MNRRGCEDKDIRPRKIPPQNVVQRLNSREIHICKPGTQFHIARQFHSNVFPNFSVIDVEKPPGFLRKFSPDGSYLVAFSSDQRSIVIYEFQGPAAAADLLQNINNDCLGPNSKVPQAAGIKRDLFYRFFKQKHVTRVVSNGESLNRECSLFTDDGKYVIVGSAAFVPENPYPSYNQLYRNNESVATTTRSPLEDYTLHLVELSSGRLSASRHFKCDKIFLSHNQGLYLYRNTLAVLSVQQQTIHIFQVTPDGRFIDVRSIGKFCYEDDEIIIGSMERAVRQTNNNVPLKEGMINSLKHRLLVHLYKRFELQCKEGGTMGPLQRFYSHFDQFRSLRMWKMQLLDENHLLIKYASEELVTLKVQDPNSQPSFLVVYNMLSTNVIAVYENTSQELLRLFETCCDLFRNATPHSEAQFTCSPSSNVYARQIHHWFKHTIINAKFGGQTEAVKRLLAQLPISAQSYSCSPYLDLSLFSYDDKWISLLERPKACGDHPIRFYARDSGLLKFKIHTGLLAKNHPPNVRRLVAFTFHPVAPFAISVQRTNADYVVNFHVRHRGK